MERISFEKKKKLLTKEEQESYENAKPRHICKDKFKNKYFKDIKYRKFRYYCHYTRDYRGAAHGIRDLKYSATKKIVIAFHNSTMIINVS